jgi:hypothetical protein
MMYGHEKSDHAIVAGKPTNKAEGSAAELVERCRDLGECAPTKHAPDSEPGKAWHRTLARLRHRIAVDTRGGSRMRESRTYGWAERRIDHSIERKESQQNSDSQISPVELLTPHALR